MVNFSDEEKADLKRPLASGSLKRDFEQMNRSRFEYLTPEGKPDLDRIIHFVADMNTLLNHTPKLFKPIKGNNFKI